MFPAVKGGCVNSGAAAMVAMGAVVVRSREDLDRRRATKTHKRRQDAAPTRYPLDEVPLFHARLFS